MNRDGTLFLPRVDAPHVYVRAWAIGCFHSLISTRTFRRALTDRVGGQLRGDKECPFSGVTKSARVWRKVPESDARSVSCCHGLEETIAVHWTQIVKYSLVSVSVVLLARWLWNRTPGTVYREVT